MDIVRTHRRNQGMSLVEVLIALVILAGGLLTMATAQIQGMKGGQNGRHLTQASVLAESQLERLQRDTWTNVPVQNWTTPVQVDSQVQTGAGTTRSEVSYMLTYRVTSLTPGKTRGIDVRVTWTESSGRNRSVTISGIRHNFEAI